MSKKILVVEDEAIIAMNEARMLKKHGYAVVTAYKGETAVDMVDHDPEISLILMDIDLGEGIDGTEAAERILKSHDLPIAFLSSHTEPEVVEKTEGITSYGYIVKNSGETVLLASIKMAFRLYEAHMELKQQKEKLNTALVKYEQTAEQLADKNEELERYFSSSLDMLCIADTEGKFIRLNPEWKKVLGYPLSELEGRSFAEFVHQEDARATLEVLEKLDTGKNVENFENRFRCRDGSYRWIEWRAKSIGTTIYAAARDITDRKQTKERLLEREALYRNLMENSIDGVELLDEEGNYLNVNQKECDMLGYSREELLTMKIADIDPNYPEEGFYHFWKDQPKGTSILFETLHRHKDGTLIPVEVNGIFFTINEKRYIFGVARDIRERKQAEHEIQSREENLRITLNSIGDAVISTDVEGNIVRMNPVAENLCGWSIDEAQGKALTKVFHIVHAHTGKKMDNPVAKVLKTGHIIGLANHTMLISKHREHYQIADSAAPIKDESGEINGVVLVFRDVTEEYEKDRKLRESEENFRNVIENSPVGIFRTTSDGRVLHVNPAMASMVGASSQQEAIDNFQDLSNTLYVHKERRRAFIKLLKEQGEVKNFEYKAKQKDGEQRWFSMNAIISDTLSDGNFVINGFTSDITERKRFEHELQREQAFLSTVLDNIEEAIIISNEKGEIIRFNDYARKIHGVPEKPLPPEQWARYYDLYRPDGKTPLPTEEIPLYRAYKGETVRKSELVIAAKNRRPRAMICNGQALTNDNGEFLGAVVSMHDITDFKNTETSLKNALQEKDFLMQELNHRVKNNLNMISSLIHLKDAEIGAAADLRDLIHQVSAIQKVHETLFLGKDLTRIEMPQYLEDLLNTIFSSSPTQKVELTPEIEDISLPTRAAVPVGLIVNELATNAIKHGFKEGETSWFSVKLNIDTNTREYTLSVANSGNPFPEEVDVDEPQTLGLQLVSSLVQQLDGRLELKRKPYPTFLIRFPLEGKEKHTSVED